MTDRDRQIIALLREGRSVEVRAEGRSMHPFLRPGDAVVIRPLREGEGIAAGELILLEREGGRPVLHRALFPGGSLVVKGDALLAADPPFAPERAAGKASELKRRGGRVHPLETACARRRNAWIARFSGWESLAARFLPSFARRSELLSRLIRAPKWLLVRALFP